MNKKNPILNSDLKFKIGLADFFIGVLAVIISPYLTILAFVAGSVLLISSFRDTK